LAAGTQLPEPGAAVLLSLANRDKDDAMPLIRRLAELGYDLIATNGTARLIRYGLGLPVEEVVRKHHASDSTLVDILSSRRVSVVVNTVTSDNGPQPDGFAIRRAAAERRIPCFTSLDPLRAA